MRRRSRRSRSRCRRCSATTRILQGYIATNSVSASVTYAAAGATIDAAVDAGANQVYGPSPLLGDTDALYKKALAAAVANARDHAEALAEAAGAKLGAGDRDLRGRLGARCRCTTRRQQTAGSTPVVRRLAGHDRDASRSRLP